MVRLAAAFAAGILLLAACDSGGNGSTEAFCGLTDNLEELENFGEGLDTTDYDSVSAEFDRVEALLDDAVDAAPDEIRDDIQLTAEVWGDLFTAMREPLRELAENPQAATQNPELFQAIQDAQPTAEEQEQLEEARQRIEQFLEDECGVDVDGDSDGNSGDGGTTEE